MFAFIVVHALVSPPVQSPKAPSEVAVEPQAPKHAKPEANPESAPESPAVQALGSGVTSEPEVSLPPELDPKAAEAASKDPEGAGEVIDVPDEAPATVAPGDPVRDPADDIDGVERSGPVFENEVTVRTAVERRPPPELTFIGTKDPPKKTATFLFGYRHFSVEDGLGRHQDWHVPSIEVTPLRRYFRLNLITEVGIEGGEAAQNRDQADVFVLQKVGVGGQYPYWVSPFAEFQVGVGAARSELFERNDLALLYTLGVDVGAQWAVTRHVFLMAAVGWLRPTVSINGYSRYYDRATIKVGFGF